MFQRTAPVKEYFATRMPNVSGQLSEDAGSASVEMVGRETVEHAPVRLYIVYNFNSSCMLIENASDGQRLRKTLSAQRT